MTCRFFAVFVCVAASRRWPTFALVAAALGCECVAGELAHVARLHDHEAIASVVWASPSAFVVGVGSACETRSRWSIVASLGHVAASAALCFSAYAQMVVSTIACAIALTVMVRQTSPRDPSRAAVLVLLAGNVASGALAMIVGVQTAYDSGIILTSNDCTHLVIAGLALWAMQAH